MSGNSPYTGPQGPVSLSERRQICEGVVGSVDWKDGGEWGYCACPGLSNHNNANGRRDCRVFAIEDASGPKTKPPGVYCLHTSCRAAIEEASTRIRSEIGKAKVRNAAPARSTPRPPSGKSVGVRPAKPTERTFDYGCAVKAGGNSPTQRTDDARPLTRFAQARAPACFNEPDAATVRAVWHDIKEAGPKASQVAQPDAPRAPGRAQPPATNAGPNERPGHLTLLLNGESPARVIDGPGGLRTKFTFEPRNTLAP